MLILKNRNPTALVSVVHIADTCNWSFVFAYLSTVFAYFFKKNFDLLYICITDKEKDEMLLT